MRVVDGGRWEPWAHASKAHGTHHATKAHGAHERRVHARAGGGHHGVLGLLQLRRERLKATLLRLRARSAVAVNTDAELNSSSAA